MTTGHPQWIEDEEENVKVLYTACLRDPKDPDAGSGTDYELYHMLLAQGVDVDLVGPFKDNPPLVEKLFNRAQVLLSSRKPAKYSNAFLHAAAREVQKAIEQVSPQVIFSLFSAPLVYVKTRTPIVYILDSTLKGSQTEWPVFSEIAYRWMLSWEKKVVARCSRIIVFSDWSRDILIQDYGVPASKITVLPIPASVPPEVIPAAIEAEQRTFEILKLLLVGKEYERKGVDIAIRVVELLNARGIPTELRVVGQNGTDQPQVRFLGLYKKKDPEQLKGYVQNYRWAHFLIHPARFEAAGIAPGEAAAFGVPTVTNACSGLSTTVKDHVSGIVLPKHSPAEAYVQVFEYYVTHRGEYIHLCDTTRQRYEAELNYPAAGKIILKLLQAAAAPPAS